ncbi:MAG TPA: butyrate kinase [Bacteroidales bacterium]|nr:butyrate kinase [Bacteroidales bacterium]HPR58719.1 butyrate kinase [Bacteroidales bacterium]HRW97089.1 butyrate kinase [Bacteroidales bacterium]
MDEIGILAINPGSTSTKIGVFVNLNPVFLKNIQHDPEELARFDKITDQFQYRKDIIAEQLNNASIPEEIVKAVVGRGGLLKPIESGVYLVNERMKEDLRNSPMGEHASNLGGLIADAFASQLKNVKAYIANPVVVDELEEIARFSGHPHFSRKSIFHALNQKAVARSHAKAVLSQYEELNLIVAHLGGGITVGAHLKGRVIDVNNGLDGDGPFSPERSGTLPTGDLVRLCFSGKYSQKEVMKMIKGEGGLVGYLGTNSAYEVEQKMVSGDQQAALIYEAMAYQVAKEIGAMSTVLKGQVDAILITGGIAHSKWFVNKIIERVHRIAPVHVYPGEDEMKALAFNGMRVVTGETEAKIYT